MRLAAGAPVTPPTGARLLGAREGFVRLQVPVATAVPELVAEPAHQGATEHLTFSSPRLTEVFRDVVGASIADLARGGQRGRRDEDGGGHMGPLQTVWLGAGRELLERGAKKGHLIGTLVTVLVVVAQAAAVLTPPEPLETVDVAGETNGGDGTGIAATATILLFVGIQGNGATLLSGALEEKSSRGVEVVLGVARPRQLLAGKIALSILALVQSGRTVGRSPGGQHGRRHFELRRPPAPSSARTSPRCSWCYPTRTASSARS